MAISSDTPPPNTSTLAAFTAAVTLGGANFLAVRFSNRELAPTWGAALRFTLAAFVFVGIAWVLRLGWPRGRTLLWTMLYGFLSFTLFYALMYWALVRVTAGIATVVLALVPLVTLLLAGLHGLERIGRKALVGSALALVGILWMVLRPATEMVLPISALAAMLAAAICAGESVIVSKRVSGNHPVITNAVGMLTGAAGLLALSAIAGDTWVVPRQTEVIWSVIYLVTLGSVGLFVLVLLVVRQWTASATAYMFVLFPVVTMLLGGLLGDEPVTLRGVVGAAIVMGGVWIGALSPSRPPPSATGSDPVGR